MTLFMRVFFIMVGLLNNLSSALQLALVSAIGGIPVGRAIGPPQNSIAERRILAPPVGAACQPPE